MYRVELYAQVRRSVFVEGLSEREAAKRFGLARGTVRKMLRYPSRPSPGADQPRMPIQVSGAPLFRPRTKKRDIRDIWDIFGTYLHYLTHFFTTG